MTPLSTVQVPGIPADAGKAVVAGHVVFVDPDGVPIVASIVPLGQFGDCGVVVGVAVRLGHRGRDDGLHFISDAGPEGDAGRLLPVGQVEHDRPRLFKRVADQLGV